MKMCHSSEKCVVRRENRKSDSFCDTLFCVIGIAMKFPVTRTSHINFHGMVIVRKFFKFIAVNRKKKISENVLSESFYTRILR